MCLHDRTCRISASQKEGSMAGEVQWSAACGHEYTWIPNVLVILDGDVTLFSQPQSHLAQGLVED